MFPIFAAIGSLLAAVAVPVAKAAALGAVTGAATFGASKALKAVTEGKSNKPAPEGSPEKKPEVAVLAADAKPEKLDLPANIQKAPQNATPVASLRPSWAALENKVPDHLREPAQFAVKKAALPDLPLLSPSVLPEKETTAVATITQPEAFQRYTPQVTISPVIRL